jgi:predicted ATP-dependent endonuclease of OLD family
VKLCSVEITNFQSIRNSNRFDIADITCLVGKNEAGKTAILQALYRLNPIIPNQGNFDVTEDYPRDDVENYLQEVESGRKSPAMVTKANFLLNHDEMAEIEAEFGNGILDNNEFILSKGYENKLCYQLNINEKQALSSMMISSKLEPPLSEELSSASTIEDLNSILNTKTETPIIEQIATLKNKIQLINKETGLRSYIFNKYIKKAIPKFLYFDEFFIMKGHENIETLKSRMNQNKLEDSDRPLLGLIELARINLDQLINPNNTQWLKNKLEGASNYLSNKILKYWSQNRNIQLCFDIRPGLPGDPQGMTNGTNIWTDIYDSKRKVSTKLGTRSRGFVWFFSFLAWFDQEQKKNPSLILLLDEPGLFLHGKAQSDLLAYLEEELKPNHQVIYTTHSPFMVDATNFNRVRIIQDKSMDSDERLQPNEDGTKVITDVLEATPDSLFPLQGALGYEISQTLFVGPNSLVVEGVADLLYLQTISSILREQCRCSLDERWTITPVGGADKVPTFIALLGAQKGLNIVTLIDIQKKDKQQIENLYKKKLLKQNHVLTFADFTNSQEADIEDMFDTDFYLKLVNDEYGSDLNKPITSSILKSQSNRIVQKLDEYFCSTPTKSGSTFNHYRPARYFAENPFKFVGSIPSTTLDRFEAAFRAVNAQLKD